MPFGAYNLISGPNDQLDRILINTVSSELPEMVYVSISVNESIDPEIVSPKSTGVAACAIPIELNILINKNAIINVHLIIL